jgi:hypothetical protein
MSFGNKKKSSAIDVQPNIDQREAALNDINFSAGGAQNQLTTGQNRFNPEQSQGLFTKALDRYNNFETDAKAAEDSAYSANYQPILNEVRATLGNQFAGMGSAGRNNSRGQYAQAVASNDLADKAGQQLLGIRQSARQALMGENEGLFNPIFANQQQLAGFDTNKAQIQAQAGQNLANARLGFQSGINQIQGQNAQMAAADRSQGKSGAGSAIGGGISLLSSLVGKKK